LADENLSGYDPTFPFSELRLMILKLSATRERHFPGEFFTTSELAEALPDETQRVKQCCLDLLSDGLLTANFRGYKQMKIAISQTGINLLAEYESRYNNSNRAEE